MTGLIGMHLMDDLFYHLEQYIQSPITSMNNFKTLMMSWSIN